MISSTQEEWGPLQNQWAQQISLVIPDGLKLHDITPSKLGDTKFWHGHYNPNNNMCIWILVLNIELLQIIETHTTSLDTDC